MRLSTANLRLNVEPQNTEVRAEITAQRLYEFFLRQIVDQARLLEAQVIFWDRLHLKNQVFCYSDSEVVTQEFHRESILAHLHSRQGLGENLGLCDLHPLSLAAYDTFHTSAGEIYVSLLGQSAGHLDYLVLLAPGEISDDQRKTIVEQIYLLKSLLDLHQESQQEKVKNHFWETILQFGQHQLQNPIAVIRLHSEALFLSLERPEHRKQVDYIRQASDCLAEQVQNLFSYSQETSIRKSACHLKTIFDRVETLLEPKLEQKMIRLDCLQDSPLVQVDRWQLEQVFENIIDNAIYFSPDAGTILVRWCLFKTELLITIADQGPGLSPIALSQLFDSSYSQRNGGTGLGLAIAKKIILAHRGNIWAENLPTGGAQFSIVLPR